MRVITIGGWSDLGRRLRDADPERFGAVYESVLRLVEATEGQRQATDELVAYLTRRAEQA